MKNFLLYSVSFIALLALSSYGYSHEDPKKIILREVVENIHWLGQATVKIAIEDKSIYFDPYQIKKTDHADIILITHKHSDHFSLSDISKLATENTTVVTPKDCMKELEKIKKLKLILLEPGMKTTISGILVEAVPAYNIVKAKYHPKENKWMGYVITIKGVKIYHAGDTERIPEMKDFACDIAMLPLGQTYTMNDVQEAAKAAIDVQAKIAIPIHYGLYEGKIEDAYEFQKILKDKVEVIIKEQE